MGCREGSSQITQNKACFSIERKVCYSLSNECHHYKAFALSTHFVNYIVPTFSSLESCVTGVPDGVG